jgi:hypothetical protein
LRGSAGWIYEMCFKSELPSLVNIEGILMDILNKILVAWEMKEKKMKNNEEDEK